MASYTGTADSLAAGAEPRGGRIGVAFDWGFAVQLASQGVLTLAGVAMNGVQAPRPLGLGMLAAAGLAVAQGEALRRGNGLAWWVQTLGNSALTVAGIGSLLVLPRMFAQGRYSFIYPTLLMLVVSPLEVWLLTRPGSRRWYGKVAPADARHSGQWRVGTVLWAFGAGIGQALVAIGVV